MKLYLDASASIPLFTDELHTRVARDLFSGADDWCSGRHCYVESIRNLHRVVEAEDLEWALARFEEIWDELDVLELDSFTCRTAAALAVETGLKTLDALHLGAMWRAGGSTLTMLTFDRRMAAAARYLGLAVVGAA